MADADLQKLRIEKPGAAGARKRRVKPVVWIAAAAAAVAASLFFSGILSPKVEVTTVSVSLVYPSQTFTRLNASGYVVAQRKAAVAAKVTGRLEWIGVSEGDHVREGQVIARLESNDVQAARAQAGAVASNSRASLGQAEANLQNSRAALEQARAEQKDAELNIGRMKDLLAKGMVAKAEHDAAEARYKKAQAAVDGAEAAIEAAQAAKRGAQAGIEAARAALRQAEVSVEYTLLRAPFDAVVLTKNADIGDIVTPIGAAANAKAAVVTIADMGSLEVEADVSESNLGQVKEGMPAEVQLDALPGARFKGEVSTIVPTADRTKASVMVKVRFIEKDPRVLPEMSAKVAFLEHEVRMGEEKPRLAVNPAAVVERKGKSVAYVIKDGKAAERPVTPGERLGDWVEVKDGLKPGEKVAVSGLDKLCDGARVEEPEK
ncbi:MAG TPA: efflux RND transporter periplasmic adaptor subunit [Nitrospirota bacterium]|nr:efflux RND transporter periplasmic adaptor subunit [Nitrospirota bacterium]